MRLMKTVEKAWKTVMDLRKAVVVLPLVFLLAQVASAGIIYQGETGTRSYLSVDGKKTMYVNIHFAVYDNLLQDLLSAPGTQRYVYQYIVENKSTSELPVGFFSVIAGPSAGMAAIGTALNTDGIDATTKKITTVAGVQQSADFAFDQTPLDIGKNSYVLMFTSDNSYRKDGKAVIKDSDNGIPVSNDDNNNLPEPLTALTLGLGGLAIIRRKMSR
jgi:hypothetical protein